MAYHHIFPEEFIQLNIELQYHPDLCAIVAGYSEKEFEVRLARIAAFCKIALDDTYTEEDLRKIADLCIQWLRRRRTADIIMH